MIEWDNSYKIVLQGTIPVGITSFLNQIIGKSFSQQISKSL